MRNGITLGVACVLISVGIAEAQEHVALPAPDPVPPGTAAPEPPNSPPAPRIPEPGSNTPSPYPYGPAPGTYGPPAPYPPPPGMYPTQPYGPPRLAMIDPVGDPFFWIGVEGLVWWVKGQPLSVPIVTTGPASQGANAGALGSPGTTSLTSPFDPGVTGGVRLFAGGWFNDAHTIGMDGSLFLLGRQSAGYGVSDPSGTGQFVINEPIAGAPFVTQVSAPGVETGAVNVNASSRFAGGDIDLLYNVHRANGWTVNLLGGFRYLELNESLSINAISNAFVTTTFTDNAGNVLAFAPPGSSIVVGDFFGTRNQFYGGQLGAQVLHPMGRWFVSGIGKVALGATHEVITINGTTNVFPVGGPPVALSGGNFANIQSGRYATDRFAFAPELQLNVGYQVTPWMRGVVGYDFLYLSSVARPGNQIDNNFDGVVHPLVPMASSSFWAQGLNLGLHFSF